MTGLDGMDAKFWLDASQWIVEALIGLAVAMGGFAIWITFRQNATRARIEAVQGDAAKNLRKVESELKSELGKLSLVNARILERLDHLPDERAFSKLAQETSRLTATLDGINNVLATVQNSVAQLVEERYRNSPK